MFSKIFRNTGNFLYELVFFVLGFIVTFFVSCLFTPPLIYKYRIKPWCHKQKLNWKIKIDGLINELINICQVISIVIICLVYGLSWIGLYFLGFPMRFSQKALFISVKTINWLVVLILSSLARLLIKIFSYGFCLDCGERTMLLVWEPVTSYGLIWKHLVCSKCGREIDIPIGIDPVLDFKDFNLKVIWLLFLRWLGFLGFLLLIFVLWLPNTLYGYICRKMGWAIIW